MSHKNINDINTPTMLMSIETENQMRLKGYLNWQSAYNSEISDVYNDDGLPDVIIESCIEEDDSIELDKTEEFINEQFNNLNISNSYTDSKHSYTDSKHSYTDSKHSYTDSKHSYTDSKHSYTDSKHSYTDSKHSPANQNPIPIRKQSKNNEEHLKGIKVCVLKKSHNGYGFKIGDYSSDKGGIVKDIKKGSPADKSGLCVDDVVLEVNGKICTKLMWTEITDLIKNSTSLKLSVKPAKYFNNNNNNKQKENQTSNLDNFKDTKKKSPPRKTHIEYNNFNKKGYDSKISFFNW